MAGKENLAVRFIEVSKVVDVATVGAGVILASGPIVLVGMLGYVIDDIAQNHIEKRNG